VKVIASGAATRPDHPAGCPKQLEEVHMDPNAIHAEIAACDSLSRQATQAGAQAYARLMELAEERDSGQIARIARFLAATYNGRAFPLDPFELRAVDIAISNDMLCCLDALRWGRADLHTLITDGDARVRAVIDRWGLCWPAGA
jgi:hypothetical protein